MSPTIFHEKSGNFANVEKRLVRESRGLHRVGELPFSVKNREFHPGSVRKRIERDHFPQIAELLPRVESLLLTDEGVGTHEQVRLPRRPGRRPHRGELPFQFAIGHDLAALGIAERADVELVAEIPPVRFEAEGHGFLLHGLDLGPHDPRVAKTGVRLSADVLRGDEHRLRDPSREVRLHRAHAAELADALQGIRLVVQLAHLRVGLEHEPIVFDFLVDLADAVAAFQVCRDGPVALVHGSPVVYRVDQKLPRKLEAADP